MSISDRAAAGAALAPPDTSGPSAIHATARLRRKLRSVPSVARDAAVETDDAAAAATGGVLPPSGRLRAGDDGDDVVVRFNQLFTAEAAMSTARSRGCSSATATVAARVAAPLCGSASSIISVSHERPAATKMS